MEAPNSDLFVYIKKTKNTNAILLGDPLLSILLKGLKNIPFSFWDGHVLPYCECTYTAVIYDDMPLIDKSFLLSAVGIMKKRQLKTLGIGEGVIYHKSATCDILPQLSVNNVCVKRADDVNSVQALSFELRKRKISELTNKKVVFLAPETVYLDNSVEIEEGSVIYPFVTLLGNTSIGKNVQVRPYSTLINAKIMDEAIISSSQIENSVVGCCSTVGPFSFLRNGTEISENVRIGDFVEIKNSKLHVGTKAAHLAYIGDAEVGRDTNVGCGTVFANYDGKKKHRTTVGERVFIGCNTNLIAPVAIGNDSFIAAGSTITDDVPFDSFAIARARQTTKPKGRQ